MFAIRFWRLFLVNGSEESAVSFLTVLLLESTFIFPTSRPDYPGIKFPSLHERSDTELPAALWYVYHFKRSFIWRDRSLRNFGLHNCKSPSCRLLKLLLIMQFSKVMLSFWPLNNLCPFTFKLLLRNYAWKTVSNITELLSFTKGG